MIRLFLLLLWTWGMGIILLVAFLCSTFVFTKLTFKKFWGFIFVTCVWPIAVLSASGRSKIWQVLTITQESKDEKS